MSLKSRVKVNHNGLVTFGILDVGIIMLMKANLESKLLENIDKPLSALIINIDTRERTEDHGSFFLKNVTVSSKQSEPRL